MSEVPKKKCSLCGIKEIDADKVTLPNRCGDPRCPLNKPKET